MYILATALFISGIIVGGCYGFFYLQTTMEQLLALLIGGFLGSSAGAIVFIYSYFTSKSYVHFDDGAPLHQNNPLLDVGNPLPEYAPSALLTHQNGEKTIPSPAPDLPISRVPQKTETPPVKSPVKRVDKTNQPEKQTVKPWWLTLSKKERRIRKLETELEKLKQKESNS